MPFPVFRDARRAAMLLAVFSAWLLAEPAARAANEWPVWGGDAGATHFSGLTDITPANVASLELKKDIQNEIDPARRIAGCCKRPVER